jgi:26S proteasome regulatory subunit N1
MRLQDQASIEEDVAACGNPNVKKQLAFMLARVSMAFATEDQGLLDILSNSRLSSYYLALGKDLDVLEPKVPEDIYKSHLDNGSRVPVFGAGAVVDSARQNLASTFVNGLVNAGFCKDKLMLSGESQDAAWIYKNKEHGMMSATASLGLLMLWDVEGGLTAIDKYLYSTDDFIKAGGLLAIGILNCSVRNESDPAMALLTEHLESPTTLLKTAAITGYAWLAGGAPFE